MKTHQPGLKKALLGMAFTSAMVGLLAVPGPAQESDIRVVLNGNALGFGQAQPVEMNDRVFVPMRRIFEALGATVDYDAGTQTVRAYNGAANVRLQIGSTQAEVNGEGQVLDVAPVTRYGATMVPLRFVSESLGADVRWDEYQHTVFINSGTSTYEPPTRYTSPPPRAEGIAIAFSGYVTSVDRHAGMVMVRNGNIIRSVRTDNAGDFRRGDAVRVDGRLRNGVVFGSIGIRH